MGTAPELRAGSLRLVPFAPRHLTDAYIGWLNSRDTMRFSEQRHRTHTRETCQAFVASFQAGPSALWAIEADDQDGRHIGNISASHDPNNRLADIGLLIGASGCQGKGYGFSAWTCVLSYLETVPDLHKITGGCMAANTAMVRIMERAKMQPDGHRPGHFLIDDQVTDLVYYSRPGRWTAP